jgi:hypothetical protein
LAGPPGALRALTREATHRALRELLYVARCGAGRIRRLQESVLGRPILVCLCFTFSALIIFYSFFSFLFFFLKMFSNSKTKFLKHFLLNSKHFVMINRDF